MPLADTMPQRPPGTVDRRTKFRSLVALARKVSTIHYGHSTVRKPSARNQTNTLVRQPQNDLLDAIATILVRDVEVVAIAASGPNIVAIQDAIQQLPGSGADDNRNYSPAGSNFMLVKEGRSHLPRSVADADAWQHYLEIPYVFYTVF
jgi:hypothetical protein